MMLGEELAGGSVLLMFQRVFTERIRELSSNTQMDGRDAVLLYLSISSEHTTQRKSNCTGS